MAMAQLLKFHGGGEDQWHNLHLEVAPDGKLAPGALFHIGGPIENGWRVVNVWETEEAAQNFFREQLFPILQKHGLKPPNTQTWWPVDDLMK